MGVGTNQTLKIKDHEALTNGRKIIILNAHGIEYNIKLDVLYAIEVYTKGGGTYEEPIDTSGWKLRDMMRWLGY